MKIRGSIFLLFRFLPYVFCNIVVVEKFVKNSVIFTYYSILVCLLLDLSIGRWCMSLFKPSSVTCMSQVFPNPQELDQYDTNIIDMYNVYGD